MSSRHNFALFYRGLSDHITDVSAVLQLHDTQLVHRITQVLRASPGELYTLFDRSYNSLIELTIITKKSVTGIVKNIQKNHPLEPAITVALPLLKRDDFNQTISTLTEMGITVIQPIITEKTHRKSLLDKEYERLETITIAAAEQSKNFSYPLMQPALVLEEFLSLDKNKNMTKIFFHPSGQPVHTFMQTYITQPLSSLLLIIGPEGDLTVSEQQLLRDHEVIFLRLTATVLRASTAAQLGAGLFRLT